MRIVRASDLAVMEFPPVIEVIPGLITEGLSILAGSPKSGKSFLCLNLSLAVAHGARALGRIPCESGDVLYVAGEDNEGRIKNRVAALRQGAPDTLHFGFDPPKFRQGGLDAILTFLDTHARTRMVVVDTLAKMQDEKGTGNVYDEDYAAIGTLQALALERHIALVLIHHTRKAPSGDFLRSVSGSTGITGSADNILVFERERHESTGTLHVTGRDIEERELVIESSAHGGWRLAEPTNQPPAAPPFADPERDFDTDPYFDRWRD